MTPQVGELLMLGFQGPTLPEWLREFEAEHGLGGVILFDYSCQTKTYDNNIISPTQVRNLCAEIKALPSRPLIFIDQEGGKVRRLKEKLGFSPLPSQATFATLLESEKRSILKRSFSEMRELGFSFDLTPVIDLNLNPKNPNIGALDRSYGDNPQIVRENVAIVNEIAKEVGLGLCLKHFPGLGGAQVDSHTELTDITKTFSETEMNLFFELGENLNGRAILLSHGVMQQWDSKNPVSMSPTAIREIRSRLHDAFLLSDDIQMVGLLKHYTVPEACVQGIRAGLDMIILGNNLLGEEKAMNDIAARLVKLVGEHEDRKKMFDVTLKRIADRKQKFF